MNPLKSGRITRRFGNQKHPVTGKMSFHNGVDISCPVATPVLAPEDGLILDTWEDTKGGKSLAMINCDGVRFGFAHLSEQLVQKGKGVKKGQPVALSGNTGTSTGPHLHFTVKKFGEYVDPLKYFNYTLMFIITLLIFSGCVTRKACDRKFPPVEMNSISETSKITTTYRDTTVYVKFPGDTIFKEILLKPGEVSKIASPMAVSEAWISQGKLNHRLSQKETMVPAVINDAVKTTVTTADRERIVHRVKKVNELTNWQLIQIWIGRALIFYVLILLIIRKL